MINVDANPFLAFSDLLWYLELSEETKLGSSDRLVSQSAGKTTGVVLKPCRA